MNKTIFNLVAALSCATVGFAGEVAGVMQPQTVQASAEAAENSTPSCSIRLQLGVMHNDPNMFEAGHQFVPTLLYGGSLGFYGKIGETQKGERIFTQMAGFSVGLYCGTETVRFDFGDANLNEDFDVKTIPLMVSYDVMTNLTDAFSINAGVRTGAMIRKTDAVFSGRDEGWSDSSTKVLPMLGLGVGAEMYITANTSLHVSYDFVWTFGDDCDNEDLSMKHRYYGTVSIGCSYAF